jgi:hypothetical protein
VGSSATCWLGHDARRAGSSELARELKGALANATDGAASESRGSEKRGSARRSELE